MAIRGPQATTRARPTGYPGYSQTLPCEPESAGMARRLVRVALTAWGLDDLADDGALIVSELVSNSVQHAQSHFIRVTVTRPGVTRVRIGVVDKSERAPVCRKPAEEDESGRGLVLVRALAKDWGADRLPWGKRVWAELRGKERG
ncbi:MULTISPECIES: ATP-binding protein [Streptomyces]|uniref:ATP-binding protein n=2 Tax=Streptomyces TaxID=1883 RepID=A0ABV9J0V7_9ACTN